MGINKALDFFIEKTNYKRGEIFCIKKIHYGYCNESYLVHMNNSDSFQVRISHNNNLIDRKQEKKIIDLLNLKWFIYFEKDTGNYIKKWIPGKTLNKFQASSKKTLFELNEKIKQIQETKIEGCELTKFDYFKYSNNTGKDADTFIKLYTKIVGQLPKQFVLSHGDLNKLNILIHKKQLTFIDWEWACLNNIYWDYANYIYECNLSRRKIKFIASINKNLDYETLLKQVFVAACLALQWANNTKEIGKLSKYKKIAIKKCSKYKGYLI